VAEDPAGQPAETAMAAPPAAGLPALQLTASRPLLIAEHLRIPYAVATGVAGGATDWLQAAPGAMLRWPRASVLARPAVFASIEAGPVVVARILDDPSAEQVLEELGGDWSPVRAVLGADGERLGSIWSEREGGLLLPFDPDEVVDSFWGERYVELGAGKRRTVSRRALMHGYYRLRSLLPRATQIALRRAYARIRARTRFPGWPVETALHDFFDLLLDTLAGVAGAAVPHLAPWPQPHTWALVLTHDVETAAGLRAIEPILELERSLGVRSCWNFVPDAYEVDDGLVRALAGDGFEVGVHGLRHDGRDLRSLAELRRRLPAMRTAAGRWNATGFRAPAMHRNWDLMPRLGFDYDASCPDTDPFEPQPGGCCTWWPFFNQTMVELPLTMPQDHTLFVILRHQDESVWVQKAEHLRANGGMAQILTHPDYLIDPRMMDRYRRLLERFAADDTAWKALPREVAGWWRRRRASTIVPAGDGWSVAGPGAGEAAVVLRRPRRDLPV
jgi:peptidoglycan/xylan/chitin deacetylase (PgdA/CDA1 family)